MNNKKKASDRAVKLKSTALRARHIAFVVTGGIASVEAVKIIRELRRRGAEVTVFMTAASQRFITPLSLEWASTRPVVMEETANVEYLHSYDLVIVAPATLNSIAKSALGLGDNVVSLLIATQFGLGCKVLFVPTMHESMKAHPLYEEYTARLRSWGADFLESDTEEEKMKIASPDTIANWVESKLRKKK